MQFSSFNLGEAQLLDPATKPVDYIYYDIPRPLHPLCLLDMPIVNGDIVESSAHLLTQNKITDHSTAVEILENEYAQRDGIDARTLLDSAKNGGLTYNDFLMLPGFIGRLIFLNSSQEHDLDLPKQY